MTLILAKIDLSTSIRICLYLFAFVSDDGHMQKTQKGNLAMTLILAKIDLSR